MYDELDDHLGTESAAPSANAMIVEVCQLKTGTFLVDALIDNTPISLSLPAQTVDLAFLRNLRRWKNERTGVYIEIDDNGCLRSIQAGCETEDYLHTVLEAVGTIMQGCRDITDLMSRMTINRYLSS